MVTLQDRRVLIINPFARGVGRTTVRRVAECLAIEDRAVRVIGRDGSAGDIAAQAVRAGVATVIAAGGDGTLHEIVQQIAGTRTALGIVPLGTSNDLARRLGIPSDLPAACAVANTHRRATVDLLSVNGRLIGTVGGLGFPALVARDCNVARRRSWTRRALAPLGGSIYSIAAAARILARGPASADFTVGTRSALPVALRASAILFGVVERFGGGIRLVPDGRLDPGTFGVLIVSARSRGDLLGTLMRLRTDRPAASHARAFTGLTSLTIRAARPIPTFGDGEWLGVRRTVRVTLERAALRVLVPRESALPAAISAEIALDPAAGEALREAM